MEALKNLTIKKNKVIVLTPAMYHLLDRVSNNRPIFEDNYLRMKMSVIRNGVTRHLVVIWDEEEKVYRIVDGQHLAKVCKEFNLDIECRIVELNSKEEITQLMIDLNNTGKGWKMLDYVGAWAKIGKTDYKKLTNYAEVEFPYIQISVIIQALTQQNRTKATKMLKAGTFTIVNKVRGEQLIEYVSDCLNILPNTRQMNEALIKLMLKTESYNHSHFIKKLKAVVKTYVFSTKEGELYKQLVKIYNS